MWDKDIYKVKVNFIRHGRTPSNEKHLYLSYTDESLSEEGKKELKKNSYPPCDIVFTSGLKRCNETAKIIYEKNDIIEIADFLEIDFGIFELKSYEDLKENPDYIEWIDKRGMIAPKGGESRPEFIKRLKRGFYKALSMSKEADEISLVVHGGTIMGIISSFTKLDYYDVQLKNAAVLSCMVEFGENNGVIFISHFSLMVGSGS